MGNTFGNIFKITTFGESHGEAVGGVVSGSLAAAFITVSLVTFLIAASSAFFIHRGLTRKAATDSDSAAVCQLS